MPIAREFNPDLVLVSAGFDAAMRDPLGGCLVTPEGYAHLLHQLTTVADGRVVVALEGGYHLGAISESMAACAAVLTGEKLPALDQTGKARPSVATSIDATIAAHRPYWRCFQGTAEPIAGGGSPAAPQSHAAEDPTHMVAASPVKPASPAPAARLEAAADAADDLVSAVAGLSLDPASAQ